MTQSIFDRFYLRRGQLAGDTLILPEPQPTGALSRALWKTRVKRALNW